MVAASVESVFGKARLRHISVRGVCVDLSKFTYRDIEYAQL
jgi:hypothetical protein